MRASLGQTDRLATIFTEQNAPNENQSPAFAFKSSLSNYGLLRLAYCSLFPRHPAAILQLLIFYQCEGEKKGSTLLWFPPLVSPEKFLAAKPGAEARERLQARIAPPLESHLSQ